MFAIFVGFGGSLFNTGTAGIILGSLLVIAGVLIGILAISAMKQPVSVLPMPLDDSILVRGGPFKYIRHPMYSSLIIASIGITILDPTVTRIIAVLCLVLVLFIKSVYEERMLKLKFKNYQNYINKTGRFLPKIRAQ